MNAYRHWIKTQQRYQVNTTIKLHILQRPQMLMATNHLTLEMVLQEPLSIKAIKHLMLGVVISQIMLLIDPKHFTLK